jgi:hypothetical protein
LGEYLIWIGILALAINLVVAITFSLPKIIKK